MFKNILVAYDGSTCSKESLIIIGSRGLGAVKGMLMGSVSSRVVQQADCHVLVIK